MMPINVKIRELFKELDTMDTSFDSSGERYWDIKLRLFQEITKKYGTEYSSQTAKAVNLPAAIVSIIVKMERKILHI